MLKKTNKLNDRIKILTVIKNMKDYASQLEEGIHSTHIAYGDTAQMEAELESLEEAIVVLKKYWLK